MPCFIITLSSLYEILVAVDGKLHMMLIGLNSCNYHEELAKQGHVQLLFTGDGLKKRVTRFLGGWWIEAAIKGRTALFWELVVRSSDLASMDRPRECCAYHSM